MPAEIDGVAVTLLVDTGADGGLLLPEAAQALSLLRDPGRRTRMRGTGGRGAAAPHAVLRELTLGGLRIGGISLPVAPLPSLPSLPRLSPPVAGLLGGDLLSAFDVEIAVPDRLLALHPLAPGCPVPWSGAGLAAARSGNRLTIEVALEGQSLRALVDTGARSIIVAAAAAGRLGITPAMLAADPGGISSGVDLRPTEFHWHRFARLQIGDEVQRDVTLTVAPLDEDVDLLLGAPFFAAHRMVLSYAAERVWVR